jgi:acyl-CoA reductase-like NAD-dependent aldehyde dehydrogenase
MSDIPLLPQVEAFLSRSHGLFIDGGYVQSHSSQMLELINPATAQVISRVADAAPADIDAAVASSNRGLKQWSQVAPATRAKDTLLTEETFGPIATFFPYDTEEELLELMNNTPYGLSASLWTNDLGKALLMLPAINAGTVWVSMQCLIRRCLLEATNPQG